MQPNIARISYGTFIKGFEHVCSILERYLSSRARNPILRILLVMPNLLDWAMMREPEPTWASTACGQEFTSSYLVGSFGFMTRWWTMFGQIDLVTWKQQSSSSRLWMEIKKPIGSRILRGATDGILQVLSSVPPIKGKVLGECLSPRPSNVHNERELLWVFLPVPQGSSSTGNWGLSCWESSPWGLVAKKVEASWLDTPKDRKDDEESEYVIY